MSFLQPSNAETTRFSYNVLIFIALALTAGIWQAFNVWLPFAVAVLSSSWVFWQIYVVPWLAMEEGLSEADKNQIAFHTQFTSNIGRLQNTVEGQMVAAQNNTKRVEELEKTVKRLTAILEASLGQGKT